MVPFHPLTRSPLHPFRRRGVRTMASPIVRMLAALVFAALLWMQARGVRDQPRRRRAFELAAGALLALAGLQFSLAAGGAFTPPPFLTGTAAVGPPAAGVLSAPLSGRRGGEGGPRTKNAPAAEGEGGGQPT